MDLKKGLFRVETCHPEVRAKAKGTMKRFFIEQIITKILMKRT
jgi:hypothetical protein